MLSGLQKEIWEKKYRFNNEQDVKATWKRVAKAIASVEKEEVRQEWEDKFYSILENFVSIPGGRITAGAGTSQNYLLNCAVLPIEDSIEGIYEAVKRSAVLAKSNYGVGFDFSPLRPTDSELSKGGISSGPVSFMKVFDASGSVIQTGGSRRAAQIGILRVDHPDIFEFIGAKRKEGVLSQFNISVGITQEFIDAVKCNGDFDLRFNGKVYRTVKAVDIWNKLVESGFNYNDPGFFFLDEVNKYNNGYYMYDIACSNPCGEIPLPPNGVCDLGNINLTKFVKVPFANYTDWQENFKLEEFIETIKIAVRFLDNVLDVSDYPYEEITERARGDRRIGLCGVAGLGSFLAMMCIPYDSELALYVAEALQQIATFTAYDASIELAKEKGPFKNYTPEYLKANFIVEKLPIYMQDKIAEYGIRNLALMTIPPVGTGSLLAGNISNGLEPIFSLEYNRNVRQHDGSIKTEPVEDYAWKLWKEKVTHATPEIAPNFFTTARNIDAFFHVKMQACLQYWIDGSISKTANIPADFSIKEYEKLLWFAIENKCKGFTTFREGTREGVLVEKKETKKEVAQPIKEEFQTVTERPRVLDGKTYKIKDPNGSIYVTLNYLDTNNQKRPWEIFMFSSNENQELYAALGKTLSAVMRRSEDISFLIDDLKSIKASTDSGGYFTPEYGFVKSRPQHISYILQEFVDFLRGPQDLEVKYEKCPECGENTLLREGGCAKCMSCLYSKCG